MRARTFTLSAVILYEMLTGTRPGPQRKRIRPRKLDKNRKPVFGRRPGKKVAIRCRVAEGIGGGHAAETGHARGHRRRRDSGADSPRRISIFTGRQNSPPRTPLSSPISKTRRAIRYLTRPFARGWRCNWNSPRS